jgi:hypothetical protein
LALAAQRRFSKFPVWAVELSQERYPTLKLPALKSWSSRTNRIASAIARGAAA